MRFINGFLCIVMVCFAVVQYNDPDAILWILIYGLTALWAGLAAFRPASFARNQLLLTAYGVTLAAIAVGAIYDRPHSIFDWYENEVVREGFGLIIATVVLLVVAFTLWRMRHYPVTARQAG
jgi:hypothetical protein